MKLSNPKQVNIILLVIGLLLCMVGGYFVAEGPSALWDLARHGYTDTPRNSTYPMPCVWPFTCSTLQWNVAGDLFLQWTWGGVASVIIGVLMVVTAFLEKTSNY